MFLKSNSGGIGNLAARIHRVYGIILAAATRPTAWGDIAMHIIEIEAHARANANQRPERQAGGGNPNAFPNVMGGHYRPPALPARGGFFTRPFRFAVAVGLSWGDLLNMAPPTLSLMGDGVTGVTSKTKTRGKPDGRSRGSGNFPYSVTNTPFFQGGRGIFLIHSMNLERDFGNMETLWARGHPVLRNAIFSVLRQRNHTPFRKWQTAQRAMELGRIV